MNRMSVWAWYCDAPQGGYLFHGNPNCRMPPFHLGCIENILCGERLIWELGYKLATHYGAFRLPYGYPGEPCPKPTTYKELLDSPRRWEIKGGAE